MYRWIPYAFVRIAMFYCAGVLFGIHGPQINDASLLWIVFMSTTLGFLMCVAKRRGKSSAAGMLAGMALFFAGTLNVKLSDESRNEDHLLQTSGNVTAFRAVVRNAPQDRPRTRKYEVAIDRILVHGTWRRANSGALLYVRKDSTDHTYSYGDVLVIRGEPQRIAAPANPDEFDLRKFLSYRQVYFQAMVSSDRVHQTGRADVNHFIDWAITARLWADGVLATHLNGERARAIASAFVLGVTDNLDSDLMSAYASTGAMHVLSVSGLHVGIVYWLLLVLFRPFGTDRRPWVLLIVSLIVLWTYAFVTGICASVLRAVVMFSFAAIARAFHYRINVYNILAATATLLLVYDPFMIMFVGFQLSFVAVLGIVAIQPGLYRLWEPTAWLWDEIWKVCSVSVAAQLATLPLCLFYFHQFPNYFLITNLFIVPGSFIVLLLGILLLAVSAVQGVADMTGWLLEKLIDLLNLLIFQVDRLPFSVIENISITPLQCGVMAVVLAMILVWVERRSATVLVVLLVLCVLYPVLAWADSWRSRLPTVTVYAVAGSTAVDLSAGNVTSYIGSGAEGGMRQIQPNRISLKAADRVGSLAGVNLGDGCDLFVWNGLRILQVQRPIRFFKGRQEVDIVIISNNAVQDLENFSHLIVAKTYVLDGTNGRNATTRLMQQARHLPLHLHSVLRDGAWTLKP